MGPTTETDLASSKSLVQSSVMTKCMLPTFANSLVVGLRMYIVGGLHVDFVKVLGLVIIELFSHQPA